MVLVVSVDILGEKYPMKLLKAIIPYVVEKILEKVRNFPFETKTSFQRDYEKGNAKNEGDIFGGTLIRLAKEGNVSIPEITRIYGILSSQ